MPLLSGKAATIKKGFEENIRIERRAGKPNKQAIAIAYQKKREGSRKGGQ
jgi:hypothetical protein